ncbi:MAG: UMP kinase [Candidatus Gracilibacteria bacterium]
MSYNRILLKISGEALKGKRDHGIDPAFTHELALEIQKIHKKNIQIAIVIGGGNIFRGAKAEANGMDRTLADYTGMLATIMNGLALQDAFKKTGISSHVLSALDIPQVCENYNKREGVEYLEKGEIVICVGGTGNPYFSTDSAAALRAIELECDIIMKGTKVDGVYDKDPMQFPEAHLYTTLSFDQVIEQNIKIMDQTAFTLCKENNMPIKVFNVTHLENIERAILEDGFGTKISGS